MVGSGPAWVLEGKSILVAAAQYLGLRQKQHGPENSYGEQERWKQAPGVREDCQKAAKSSFRTRSLGRCQEHREVLHRFQRKKSALGKW